MSKATKRKHVTKEVLDDFVLPEGDRQIVKVRLLCLMNSFWFLDYRMLEVCSILYIKNSLFAILLNAPSLVLALARNCCLARMLPGEAELVSE